MAIPSVNNNEFLNSPTDYKVRPYAVGMKRHNETISTIVVYKRGEQRVNESEDINYLENYEGSVESISSPDSVLSRTGATPISVGTPEVPDGDITTQPLDGENEYYGIFNNFSLLNVREVHNQIVKLHVNFGADWNAFFFGDEPRVYQFSGFFIDSMDYPYYQEFMTAYDKYLAGRKSIENEMQIKFIYDGKIVDGYMLNITTTQTAADQLIKSFNFTVLVKGFTWARINLVPRVNSAENISGSGSLIMKEEFNALINTERLRREVLTNPRISANNDFHNLNNDLS